MEEMVSVGDKARDVGDGASGFALPLSTTTMCGGAVNSAQTRGHHNKSLARSGPGLRLNSRHQTLHRPDPIGDSSFITMVSSSSLVLPGLDGRIWRKKGTKWK
ncbi:hypothetical protein RIF29_29702 [Crotalaria pallida]|uniref:Uncharacterized protein n=1 Tax=Crotalaria pallida TaxID=3830 RepID=A0AAN9EF07_CROPI